MLRMDLLRFKYRSLPWLRHALALLMLCFALSIVAHAGHSHDPKAGIDNICGYCTAFSHAVDAPVRIRIVPPAQTVLDYDSTGRDVLRSIRPRVTAQPRAPPSC